MTTQQTRTNGAATPPAPPRSGNTIIRPGNFPAGEPQFLRLDSLPNEVEGNYGTQWQYFCDGNLMFYADAKLHAAITRSGAEQKDEIAITRTQRGNANNWSVQKIDERGDAQEPPPPPAPHVADLRKEPPSNGRRIIETPGRITPSTDALLTAHMAAINVVVEAEKYAATKGLALRYSAEDVRAMAATIYIRHIEDDINARKRT